MAKNPKFLKNLLTTASMLAVMAGGVNTAAAAAAGVATYTSGGAEQTSAPGGWVLAGGGAGAPATSKTVIFGAVGHVITHDAAQRPVAVRTIPGIVGGGGGLVVGADGVVFLAIGSAAGDLVPLSFNAADQAAFFTGLAGEAGDPDAYALNLDIITFDGTANQGGIMVFMGGGAAVTPNTPAAFLADGVAHAAGGNMASASGRVLANAMVVNANVQASIAGLVNDAMANGPAVAATPNIMRVSGARAMANGDKGAMQALTPTVFSGEHVMAIGHVVVGVPAGVDSATTPGGAAGTNTNLYVGSGNAAGGAANPGIKGYTAFVPDDNNRNMPIAHLATADTVVELNNAKYTNPHTMNLRAALGGSLIGANAAAVGQSVENPTDNAGIIIVRYGTDKGITIANAGIGRAVDARAAELRIINGANAATLTIAQPVFAKKITADAAGGAGLITFAEVVNSGADGVLELTGARNLTFGNKATIGDGNALHNGLNGAALVANAGPAGPAGAFAGINTGVHASDIVFANDKASVANIFSKGGAVNVTFAAAGAGAATSFTGDVVNSYAGGGGGAAANTLTLNLPTLAGINYTGNAISAARALGAAAPAALDPQFVKVIFGANGGTYGGKLTNATLSTVGGVVTLTQPDHIGQLTTAAAAGKYVLPDNVKLRGGVDATGGVAALQFTGNGEIAGAVVAGDITNTAAGTVKLGKGVAQLSVADAGALGINGAVPAVAAANVTATSITVSKGGQSYELGAQYTGDLIFDGAAAGQDTNNSTITVPAGITGAAAANTFTTGGTLTITAGDDVNDTTFANKAGSTANYKVTAGNAANAIFNNVGAAAGGGVAAVAGGDVNYEVTAGAAVDLTFAAVVAGVAPGATSAKVSTNTGVITFGRDETVKLTGNADHTVNSVVLGANNLGTIDASEADKTRTLTFTAAVGNANPGAVLKTVKIIDVSGGSNVVFSHEANAKIKVKNDDAAVLPVISLADNKYYNLVLEGNAANAAAAGSAPILKVGAGANGITATINTPKLTSIDYSAGTNLLDLSITDDLTTKIENYDNPAAGGGAALVLSSDDGKTQRVLTLSSIVGNTAGKRFGGVNADNGATIVLPAADLYFTGFDAAAAAGAAGGNFIALGLSDDTAKFVISSNVKALNNGAAPANKFAIASFNSGTGAFAENNGTVVFTGEDDILVEGNIGKADNLRVGTLQLTEGDVAVDDASVVWTKKIDFALIDDAVNPTLNVKASALTPAAGKSLVVATNKVGKGNIKINNNLNITDQFIIGTQDLPIGSVIVDANAAGAGAGAAGLRTVIVNTAEFYGSVGTAADGSNKAVITNFGLLQNIGTSDAGFNEVVIEKSAPVDGLYSRTTQVKAGQVLGVSKFAGGGANNFVGAITLEAGIAAAGGGASTAAGKLVLLPEAKLNNTVAGTGAVAGLRGSVRVSSGASVNQNITGVDSVTFSGGVAADTPTVIAAAIIDNPILNGGEYAIKAASRLNNATLGSPTMTLSNNLTLNGATVTGATAVNTKYDGNQAYTLEVVGNVNVTADGSIDIVLNDQSNIVNMSEANKIKVVSGINLVTAGKITGSVANPNGFVTYDFDPTTGYFNPKDNTEAATDDFVANISNPNVTKEEVLAAFKSGAGDDLKKLSKFNAEQAATAIDKLTTSDAAVATTAVVGNVVTAALDVMNNRMFDVSVTPGAGMDTKVSQAGAAGVAAGDDMGQRHGLWFMPFYNQGRQKMLKSVSGYKSEGTGGTIGFDTMANDTMTVGLAATYVQSDVKFKDTLKGDKTKVQTLMFSIYGVQEFAGNWFAQGVASFGSSKVKGNAARIGFSNNAVTNLTAQSKYDVMSYGGEVQVGYNYKFADNVALTPTVGLAYNKFNDSGYTETNAGNQNRTVGKKSTDKVEVLAGLRAAMTTDMGGVVMTPDLHVNVRQALTNKSPKVDVRLSGSTDPLPTTSTKPSKTLFNVGLGLNLKNGMMEYGLGADAYMAKKYTGYQGSLKVRVNF